MSVEFEDLPAWKFKVEEVSVGVYRVTGTDRLGHRIVLDGLDPDALLDECRAVATSIDRSSSGRG